ncbi:MAG: DUF1232 domain-containing protein [Actinobacteria bacterium]|nr:DUF1232 domain-containing protein [Actinomycetota bacterium]
MERRDKVPSGNAQTDLKEYAYLLPRLAKLVLNLLRDPRVPARSKATLVLAGAYIASPLDLVPDFIPGFGKADDIILAAFALDQIVNRIPDSIVREHWDGEDDVLDIVRQVLDLSSGLVPAPLRRLLSG